MQKTAKLGIGENTWQETFVTLRAHDDDLVGVLTEPEHLPVRASIILCGSLLDERKHLYSGIVQLARALTQVGYITLRFDYRGFGESAGNSWEITPDALVEDTQLWLAWLKNKWPAVEQICLGVRIGAMVALCTAVQRNAVRLIACQPALQLALSHKISNRSNQDKSAPTIDCSGWKINHKLFQAALQGHWHQYLPTMPALDIPSLLLFTRRLGDREITQYAEYLRSQKCAITEQQFISDPFWLSPEIAFPVNQVVSKICEWTPLAKP